MPDVGSAKAEQVARPFSPHIKVWDWSEWLWRDGISHFKVQMDKQQALFTTFSQKRMELKRRES